MTQENQYFILQENLSKVAEVRYLDEQQNLLTREELEEQQRVEESYCEEFVTNYGDLRVAKGYGPVINGDERHRVTRKIVEIIGKEVCTGRRLKNGERVSYIKFYLDEELRYKDEEKH